jgi:hypothetical protein
MSAEQGSDEWKAERAGKATASNFDKIMMSPTTAGYQGYLTQLVLERIYGRPVETFKNKAMERGNELEPVARMRYQLATKTVTSGAPPFMKHPTLAAGASLDDQIGDDGIVEYKCPLANNHYYTLKTGKVPRQYEWQVVGQQWISGRKWTDFVSFSDEFPPNAALAIIRVERDEKMIELLESRVRKFLSEVDEAVNFIQNYGRGKDDVNSKSSGEATKNSDVSVQKTKDVVRATQVAVGKK